MVREVPARVCPRGMVLEAGNTRFITKDAECTSCGCSTMSDFFKDCPCPAGCHNKAPKPRIVDYCIYDRGRVEGRWEKKKK